MKRELKTVKSILDSYLFKEKIGVKIDIEKIVYLLLT